MKVHRVVELFPPMTPSEKDALKAGYCRKRGACSARPLER